MMTSYESERRIAAAEKILAEFGLSHPSVREAGHEREVAVISATREDWEALLEPTASETVRNIKVLGFRYVAIDLDPRPASG